MLIDFTATMTEEVRGPRGKLQFARVEVRREKGGWTATPTGARGSNLISTVARANGLAMVPAGTDVAAIDHRPVVALDEGTDALAGREE